MGNASSSAARLQTASSVDPLMGVEPANDTYGSLAALGSRQKPRKKPVLVLDAEELAKAHALFQEGAAEQLEDGMQNARRPVMLSLAPIGSDMDLGDAETADDNDSADDETSCEADAPEPEKILRLTGSGPEAQHPAMRAENAKKRMVALPTDTQEASVDEAATNAAANNAATNEAATTKASDAAAHPHLDLEDEAHDPDALPPPEAAATQAHHVDRASTALPESTPDKTPDSIPYIEDQPERPDTRATAPLAQDRELSAPEHSEPAQSVPREPSPAGDKPRITRMEEDAVDGTAFMREAQPRKLVIADGSSAGQNSLRAKLLREPAPEPDIESPSFSERIARWLADVWSRYFD